MKKIITSYGYSILIIIIGVIFSSILYYFNITSDKVNSIILYLLMGISMITGSIIFSKNMKYKGIINGLIYFLSWFIIMFLTSIIIFKSKLELKTLIYYTTLCITSILGGIIGKNTKTSD